MDSQFDPQREMAKINALRTGGTAQLPMLTAAGYGQPLAQQPDLGPSKKQPDDTPIDLASQGFI